LLACFDGNLPLARAHTIPADWYIAPAMHLAERKRIFQRSWIIVGRAEQVGEPGTFLTADVAGMPVLVVRDGEGVLRAFANVCRHRAAVVVTAPCGKASKLRCPYHGWTYDLAGRLRGTPEFEGVQDFERDDLGLPPLSVETSGPFVAVHAGLPKLSFADYLAPLSVRLDQALSDLTFVERREYMLRCNWKVFVDNYLDGGYHVNSIHPGLGDMLDYTQYSTQVFDWTSVQTSPLRTDPSSVRAGRAQYWYVFPNFMLNLYDGVMDTNLVWPLSVDRCMVAFDFWFSATGTAADGAFRTRSLEVAERVQQEDIAICEQVQRGLASGWYTTGRFSVRREAAGYHFHQLLARLLSDG
jgi:choline monooxygenase